MRPADVLILGGGIAGLSTAWHLSRSGGARVTLLEREPAFGRVSSGQNAAILRSFGDDPAMNAVTRRGGEFLRRPPADFAPVPLFDACGLLLVVGAPSADRVRAALDAEGAAAGARVLGPGEARALVPHLDPGTANEAALRLWFPADGRIDVAALIDAFAAGARRAGVELRPGTAARSLLVERGRVAGVVCTDGDEIRAATTVIAAGAWAGRLGRAAGSAVELRPTRRHLLVTAPDGRVDRRWPVLWLEDAGFYARPESGGLLLSACDLVDVDPDDLRTDPAVRERIAEKTARLLPGFADAGAAHFWCGLRTLTADDRFAIGPDPDLAGLFWVAGLGGHGMGAGAEVGRIAAMLLTGDPSAEPLASAFDPARLAASPAGPR